MRLKPGTVGRILPWLFIAMCGCARWNRYIAKHDNPVMPKPPSRISFDDSDTTERLAELESRRDAHLSKLPQESLRKGGIRLTSSEEEENEIDDDAVFNAKVVARVNGAPIFAGDIFALHGDEFFRYSKGLNAEQRKELRDEIIMARLFSFIRDRLVAERMMSDIKPEQRKQLAEIIDKQFEKTQIPALKKAYNVNTKTELEDVLRTRCSSLEAAKRTFAAHEMAGEYLRSKMEKPKQLERRDLIDYYEAHLADYQQPARVTWEQILIFHSPPSPFNRSECQDRASETVDLLRQGRPFEKVAKEYSMIPDVKIDWVSKGSMRFEELEAPLFTLRPGEVSDPIKIVNGYAIVRVIDRKQETVTPFEDVQDEISKKLRESQSPGYEKLLREMMESAIIETDYNFVRPKGLNTSVK